MNLIYASIFISLFFACAVYLLLFVPLLLTVVLVGVTFLIVVSVLLKKCEISGFRYLVIQLPSIFKSKDMDKKNEHSDFTYQKCFQNNALPSKTLTHRGVYNLSLCSTPCLIDNNRTRRWNRSNDTVMNEINNKLHTPPQEYSTTKTTLKYDSSKNIGQYAKPFIVPGFDSSHMPSTNLGVSTISKSKEDYCTRPMSTSSNYADFTLNTRLHANVSSPGFCSRVADQLSESMTHQPKYDSVGAFPIINLKNNVSKLKIKSPVRVRLAPRSSNLSYSDVGMDTTSRSPLAGPDESMKSVLQVLKEISRKRMHSHIDDDVEDSSKRLRVSDIQYNSDSLLHSSHSSLLHPTVQGKRPREETSPNEDVKKKRKSLLNNEITSSLSSSLSIKAPHLKTIKRKASDDDDDSAANAPSLGKQLKIQTEVTPPLPRVQVIAERPPISQVNEVKQNEDDDVTMQPIISEKNVDVIPVITENLMIEPPGFDSIVEPPTDLNNRNDEDQAVSRLLGRRFTPVETSSLLNSNLKKNVFRTINDLGLSPPKENRLTAMLAVLGESMENIEEKNLHADVSKKSEKALAAKALFTSPSTPYTPKQTKKVSFAETLTETKLYDKDQCASPSLSSVTSLNEKSPVQTPNNIKPMSLNLSWSQTPSPQELSTTNSGTPLSTPLPLSQQRTPGSSNTNSQPSITSQTEVAKTPTLNFSPVTSPSLVTQSGSSLASTNINTSNLIQGTDLGPQPVIGVKAVENDTTKAAIKGSLFKIEKSTSDGNKTEIIKSTQLVNGFTTTTTTSSASSINSFHIKLNPSSSSCSSGTTFIFDPSASKVQPTDSVFSTFKASSNSVTEAATTFTFSAPTSSAQPAVSQAPTSLFSSSFNQPDRSVNIFNNAVNNAQSNLFNKENSGSKSSSQLFVTSTTSNQISDTVNDSKVPLTNTTVSTTNLFGGSVTATSKFGSGVSFSISQTNGSPFGAPATITTTSQSNPGFSTSIFGTAVSANSKSQVNIETQSTLFNQGAHQTPPSIFSTSNNSNTIMPKAPNSGVFNSQNNNNTTNVGNTPTMFGCQTTSGILNLNSTNTFSFGNTSTQKGFCSTVTSNQNTGSSNAEAKPQVFNSSLAFTQFGGSTTATNKASGNNSSNSEAKPPIFSSSSAFMFGNSAPSTNNIMANNSSNAETKPGMFNSSATSTFGSGTTLASKEPVKPFGTVVPFSFGSNVQQTNNITANPVQPTVPTFGNPNSGFSLTPQTPNFTGGLTQPPAQPFTFGQQQSTPGLTFQFNAAAPQPTQGGMFSIGSGGSSASRSKPGVLRRRHKPA